MKHFIKLKIPINIALPMLETYRAISNAGIKVTIDGHGADELFSGYGHLICI
jgi:asparagine synthase (glutamine-hydrolysing)